MNYGEVAHIRSKKEANHWRDKVIGLTKAMPQHESQSIEEIREMVNHNIGYQAGYNDLPTFNRILKLFGVEHPLFGYNLPGPADAFNVGALLGDLMHNKGMSIKEAMLRARSFLGTDTKHETAAKLMKLKEEEDKKNGIQCVVGSDSKGTRKAKKTVRRRKSS